MNSSIQTALPLSTEPYWHEGRVTGSLFQIVTGWFRDWSSGVQTQVRYNTEKEEFGDVAGDWWVGPEGVVNLIVIKTVHTAHI